MEALRAQFPASNFSLLAVVLALPLIGAFVNGVFGKRLGKEGVRLMALSAIGGAFLASVVTFLLVPSGGSNGRLAWLAWRWFSVTGRMGQSIPIDIAFSVDGMTATMMLSARCTAGASGGGSWPTIPATMPSTCASSARSRGSARSAPPPSSSSRQARPSKPPKKG